MRKINLIISILIAFVFSFKMKEKEKVPGKKSYKKFLIGVIILEISLILFTGPILIGYQKIYHKFNPSDSALFAPEEYNPVDPARIPKKIGLVKVTYDKNDEVVKEEYYTYLGEIKTVDFQNGKWTSSGTRYFSAVFIGIFAFLGIASAALGTIIYKPLSIYGIALIATAFVLGIVKTFIVDLIVNL